MTYGLADSLAMNCIRAWPFDLSDDYLKRVIVQRQMNLNTYDKDGSLDLAQQQESGGRLN